jgi:hypothetical protein
MEACILPKINGVRSKEVYFIDVNGQMIAYIIDGCEDLILYSDLYDMSIRSGCINVRIIEIAIDEYYITY